jgi:hypothetical protein
LSIRKNQYLLPLPSSTVIKNWEGFSSGANDRVLSIQVDNQNNVYAGGIFTAIGGISVNKVAKWDGTIWSPLGASNNGVNGFVNVIKLDNSNNLIVGGTFTSAGGIPCSNIAKYDISNDSWSSLGSGTNGSVNSIIINNNDMYIAGSFTTDGLGNSINRIAKWDSITSTWNPLIDSGTSQNGLNGTVLDMTFDLSGNLWVVGNFSNAGGKYALFIAKWDGSLWTSFNANTFNTVATSIVVDDSNNLYVGGYFTTVMNFGSSPVTANYIAKLTAGVWSPVIVNGVNGVNDVIEELYYNNGKLYVGGNFTSAGDISSNYFSVYDGNTWNNLDSTFNNSVASVVSSNGDLYVSGLFTSPFNRITKYTEVIINKTFYIPRVKRDRKI